MRSDMHSVESEVLIISCMTDKDTMTDLPLVFLNYLLVFLLIHIKSYANTDKNAVLFKCLIRGFFCGSYYARKAIKFGPVSVVLHQSMEELITDDRSACQLSFDDLHCTFISLLLN